MNTFCIGCQHYQSCARWIPIYGTWTIPKRYVDECPIKGNMKYGAIDCERHWRKHDD